METTMKNIIIAVTLFLMPTVIVAQTPPPLGAVADFVLFSSAGAISNLGISQVTGNFGTSAGAVSGFGNVNGQMHIGNATTIQCATDLNIARANLSAQIQDTIIGLALGAGQTLLPNVYLIQGAGSLTGTLTLDGGGDPNACFVFQVNGALGTAAGSKIILTNGVQACNVFWRVDGAMTMGANTSFKGTIVVFGAISLAAGCSLEGRALTVSGAISVSGFTAGVPLGCGSPVFTGPVAPTLCAVRGFALLTFSGTVTNTGTTNVVDDIGTNSGAVSGYDPLGIAGAIHAGPDASTAEASSDLSNLYSSLNGLSTDIQLLYPVLFGNSQVLTPHVYVMNAATVLTDTIFLDSRGVADAVFVIRIMGALTTNTNPQVVLVGGTQSKNVFWQVEGAVTINGGNFNGMIVANNGAIILNSGVVLSGGAFSTFGNIITHDVEVSSANLRIWNGDVDTDWFNTGNWCPPIIPTASNDVAIPFALSNRPHVTLAPGAPAVCADLTIDAGATLIIDAGKALTVSGTLDNAGTVDVKADSIGIGSLITEGIVTGNGSFRMEQYLAGSGGATPDGLFWYVSSPTAMATSNVYNAAGTDKLWSANEVGQTYTQITDNITSLNIGQGYVTRLGATGTNTFTGGAFNTGNISEGGLTRSGTTATDRGYNLVGNPYPSTVSWNNVVKTNLETSMYYRTNQGSSMLMDTYNAMNGQGTNNNGGGAVDGDIPPTQAFWVRVDADGSTGQLDFTNAMRSHGTLAGVYRMAAEEGTVRIALSNGTNSDEAIILFDPSAQDGYDDYDSQKFWASASLPQVYTSIGIDTLVINGLTSTATNPTVDLGVKIPTAGDYTLNVNEITVVGETVHLEDRMLSIFQDLNVEPIYAFTSDAGNISTRFALHFGLSITDIDEVANNIGVYAANKQINVLLNGSKTGTITVFDMTGRMVYSQSIMSPRTIIDFNTASGIYVVKVETADQAISRKISIE
jgi:hypothetical protein